MSPREGQRRRGRTTRLLDCIRDHKSPFAHATRQLSSRLRVATQRRLDAAALPHVAQRALGTAPRVVRLGNRRTGSDHTECCAGHVRVSVSARPCEYVDWSRTRWSSSSSRRSRNNRTREDNAMCRCVRLTTDCLTRCATKQRRRPIGTCFSCTCRRGYSRSSTCSVSGRVSKTTGIRTQCAAGTEREKRHMNACCRLCDTDSVVVGSSG